MNEWYLGNIVYKQQEYDYRISEDNPINESLIEKERVLLKKIDNTMYNIYNLNCTGDREYELIQTQIILRNDYNSNLPFVDQSDDLRKTIIFPHAVKNLELVYNGNLSKEIINHIAMYLNFQNQSQEYTKDENSNVKKMTL